MCPYTSLLSMFGYIIIMVLSYESLEDCQSFGIKTDKHLSNFIKLAIDFPIGNFGIIASESPLFQESVILARGAPPPPIGLGVSNLCYMIKNILTLIGSLDWTNHNWNLYPSVMYSTVDCIIQT